jgi:hypothetical protein
MDMQNITYWAEKQSELGYVSRWSIGDDLKMEDQLAGDESPVVTYTVYAKNATIEQLLSQTAPEVTYRAVAKDTTVAELYRAAEQVIKEAVSDQGDWHIYIEGFKRSSDGSLSLVTGS